VTPYDLDVRDAGPELDVPLTAPEIDARTTLADLRRALDAVARVLAANAHRGDTWRREPVFSHARHAEAHLACWRESRNVGDLKHALTRCAMALELALPSVLDGNDEADHA